MMCVCRNCGQLYNENKSRAMFKGYCTSICLHAKARKLGFRAFAKVPPQTEYQVLKQAGEIGSVPYTIT